MTTPKIEKVDPIKVKYPESKSIDATGPQVGPIQEHCPALLSFFTGEEQNTKIENLKK